MPRLQKVTNTSRRAFIVNRDTIASQREAVAAFILSETKAGRWTWIRKIAENADKIGDPGLAQISSAGRALNELKDRDIIIAGKTHVLHRGVSFKPKGCRCAVEPWAMILKK